MIIKQLYKLILKVGTKSGNSLCKNCIINKPINL